jgi:YbgC/YbaW family acyl-CoA thioester hydrolase
MPSKTPFVTTEHVRWEDIDLAGIARYSSYTRFLDIAETDLYRSLGKPLSVLHSEYKVWLPRKILHMDYFSPARLDDELTIAAYFSNIGRTSVTLSIDLFRDDRKTLVAAAYLVLVCVDIAFQKTALPPELKRLVDPYAMSVEEARWALQDRAEG